ncbi:hypothetical protein GLOIN_2v1793903 [Rhizophagus clarus]|uniref:CCHC-type domain-containing protein n=1 Tax=Rhizophagus clarus TaxID=94130 RepID=A0A8H3MGL7_9GLOM|nr:hypothetical protein GLOIN_2v1793903 [Rhizophagus clarus]
MHTHAATFHIRLLRKRWYKNPELNGKNEPFVYAAKFQNTELLKQPENQEVSYLTAMIQNNVDKWDQTSKSNLDERIFYGRVMGMAKKVTLKAVEKCDTRIFEIFKEYLDENGNLENNDSRNSESDFNLDVESSENDEENDCSFLHLQNPMKRPKKGRPKGTKRIKSVTEISGKNKRHCKICGKVGHYSNTCINNPNRSKGKK